MYTKYTISPSILYAAFRVSSPFFIIYCFSNVNCTLGTQGIQRPFVELGASYLGSSTRFLCSPRIWGGLAIPYRMEINRKNHFLGRKNNHMCDVNNWHLPEDAHRVHLTVQKTRSFWENFSMQSKNVQVCILYPQSYGSGIFFTARVFLSG